MRSTESYFQVAFFAVAGILFGWLQADLHRKNKLKTLVNEGKIDLATYQLVLDEPYKVGPTSKFGQKCKDWGFWICALLLYTFIMVIYYKINAPDPNALPPVHLN